MRARASQRGQAAVESAIVLPLFVFLILGTLQLGLMHQARLLTKYAAYKATRVGALNNAKKSVMESEAVAVLLPLLSHDSHGVETIKPITSPTDFQTKWLRYGINLMPESGMKYAEIMICGPTTADAQNYNNEIDFDDPASATSTDWKASELTKLRVQVTFNYRMPIPFANWVIWMIAKGQQIAYQLRLGDEAAVGPLPGDLYTVMQKQNIYVLPIRANYSMRMQSNVYLSELPSENKCQIPFAML